MARRIVISCDHGHIGPHLTRELPTAVSNEGWCREGGRVLDPRLYRTDPWTKRTVDRINALALEGEDGESPEVPKVWWCEVHHSMEAITEQAGVCWLYDGDLDCRMVRKLLVDPPRTGGSAPTAGGQPV